jgi:hypothetical protein
MGAFVGTGGVLMNPWELDPRTHTHRQPKPRLPDPTIMISINKFKFMQSPERLIFKGFPSKTPTRLSPTESRFWNLY